MPLYINDILWEKESHYSHEFKINKEKYELNNLYTKVYYVHSLDTEDNMLSVLTIILLTTCVENVKVFVNYLPFERDDKSDAIDLGLKKLWSNIDYTVLGEEHVPNKRTPWFGMLEVDPTVELEELKDTEMYVFPDSGAENRYKKPKYYIRGSKKRDSVGSLLNEYNVQANLPIPYIKSHIETLIVKDDICSMGGTFIKTHRALRKIFGEDIKIVLKVHYFEASALKVLENSEKETVLTIFDDVIWEELI